MHRMTVLVFSNKPQQFSTNFSDHRWLDKRKSIRPVKILYQEIQKVLFSKTQTNLEWFWKPDSLSLSIGARMMEVVVTTGAIRRAKLQSNRHHQQTNTQLFVGRMPSLLPNQQCQSTEVKFWKLDCQTKTNTTSSRSSSSSSSTGGSTCAS